jgi:hypothetical protein
MNKKAMIVGAVLAIAAAAAVYQSFFKSMKGQPEDTYQPLAAAAVYQSFLLKRRCTCTIVGGTPGWSGSPPCPPATVSPSRCPYP